MAEGLDLGMDTLKVGKLGLAPGFSQGVQRLGQLSSERKKADEKYEADSSGLQASMTKERAAADALPVPKLDKVATEFKYQGVKGEDLRDMMQTWFAFAAIGGAMTRQPMTAALNAFSGAIKGFVQGDKLEYDRQKDEFDRNFKTAIAKNQQAQQEYKLAFDKHRGNMQDLMNEWSIIAKKHGDTVASSNMERADVLGQLKHIENLAKMDQHAREQASRDARMFTHFGETMRHNRAMEAARDREMGIRERVAQSKSENAKAMTAIQATMYEDVATGYYRMDILHDMAQQTGELPGGSMFLQSQMHNDGIISAVRNYGVNKTLPEGYQMTDALLLGVAFDVASARSGGRGQLSDAKIREVTRQMPLSSDTPETRKLKYGLIENQLEAANTTLPAPYQYDKVAKKQRGAGTAAPAGGGGNWSDADEKRLRELEGKSAAK